MSFKDFDKIKAFLGIGFVEKEAVVSKEEVGID